MLDLSMIEARHRELVNRELERAAFDAANRLPRIVYLFKHLAQASSFQIVLRNVATLKRMSIYDEALFTALQRGGWDRATYGIKTLRHLIANANREKLLSFGHSLPDEPAVTLYRGVHAPEEVTPDSWIRGISWTDRPEFAAQYGAYTRRPDFNQVFSAIYSATISIKHVVCIVPYFAQYGRDENNQGFRIMPPRGLCDEWLCVLPDDLPVERLDLTDDAIRRMADSEAARQEQITANIDRLRAEWQQAALPDPLQAVAVVA